MLDGLKDAYLYFRGKRKTELGRRVDHTAGQVEEVRGGALRVASAARRQLGKLLKRLRRTAFGALKHVRDFVLFLRGKKKTVYGRWLGRRWKQVKENAKSLLSWARRGLRRTYKGLRRALSIKRQRTRLRNKWSKYRETRAMLRQERGVKRQIDLLVPGPRPLLVGPWISEVGFEVLYWLPFLNHVVRHYGEIERERVFVVSRGGAGAWYRGIGSNYLEIFDLMTPATFATRSEERRESGGGTHKHQRITDLDREILEAARSEFNIPKARLCHPSLMYRLFTPCWYGWRPLRVLIDHTRFEPVDVQGPDPEWGLPEEYVAVKFYTATATPDTPENRMLFQDLVRRLADRTNVVLLDTGLAVDEHEDFLFGGSGRVIGIRDLLQPRDNLEVQSRIIAGARTFIGTCGSLAWLAPMLGVDTVALYENPQFLSSHLYVAHRAYVAIKGGAFTPVHIDGLRRLGMSVGDGIVPPPTEVNAHDS